MRLVKDKVIFKPVYVLLETKVDVLLMKSILNNATYNHYSIIDMKMMKDLIKELDKLDTAPEET